ncbi:MAG: DUF4493 domain-containing protein [Bacteroidales bacterium]|nr:DUF4493 domain-containing protein [Bacteroidales bacterium]
MKSSFAILAAGFVAAAFISSCFRLNDDVPSATLVLSIDYPVTSKSEGLPEDPSSFILEIRGSEGKTHYRSIWSERASRIELSPGNYTVSVVSDESTQPAYSKPIFGDSRTVSLVSGETTELELVASQINAGIRLLPDEAFLASYRNASVFLRSKDGTLAYGFDEERTAYFLPGTVQILMNHDGYTGTVYQLELEPARMLTLRLSVAEKLATVTPVTSFAISVAIDSSRVWVEDSFAYDGGEYAGGIPDTPAGAVGVKEARKIAGTKAQWVYGYVVGGDLSSSSCSFEAPFSSRTNLLIAASAGEKNRADCMSVQLTQGDIRNALNLVDNPGLLGKKIYVKGDIVEAYYKLPGIQNLSDYRK